MHNHYNDEDFYPGASEDFFGERPDGSTVPNSDNEHSSRIGCMAVVVIVVGIMEFVFI